MRCILFVFYWPSFCVLLGTWIYIILCWDETTFLSAYTVVLPGPLMSYFECIRGLWKYLKFYMYSVCENIYSFPITGLSTRIFLQRYRLRFGPLDTENWASAVPVGYYAIERRFFFSNYILTIQWYTRNSKTCASNTAELKGKQYASWPLLPGQPVRLNIYSFLSHLTLMLTPSCCKPGQVLSTPLLYSFLPSLVFRLFCIVLKRLLVEGL